MSEMSPYASGPEPSRTATALLESLVRETHRAPGGVRRRVLAAVRKARLLAGDPAVSCSVSGRELIMPLSHDLPIHRAQHPDYSLNLGRVAAALDELRPGASIVDIGANIGDSVAVIRDAAPNAPILCIEGDAQFLPYLRHNVRDLADVEVAPVYVSHAAESRGGGVAVVRSSGTAQLVDVESAVHGEAVSARPLAAILADHPRFARPRLIKIDTDGHDADIIFQIEDVLTACRPVVFFEFDPPMAAGVGGTDPHAALERLARLGYHRALLFANTGALVGVLDAGAWASEVPGMSAEIGLGRPVTYFDVCVFGPHDGGLADTIERRERSFGGQPAA